MAARIVRSLKKEGIRDTFTKVAPLFVDVVFDYRYGVDTCRASFLDDLTVEGSNKESGYPYKATRVLPLRRMFQAMRPMITPGSVFLDLGCGKGRAMLIACDYGFTGVRGVEFARELSDIAHANMASYKARTGTAVDLAVFHSDVCSYEISPEENVFFIANSFDGKIVKCVVDNIAASVAESPRKVLISYYNPHHGDLVEAQKSFVKLDTFTFYNDRFSFYTN